jgi:hypothetical protein
MKTAIIALVALIAAAPAVLAQNVSSKMPNRHHVSRKHPPVVSAGYASRHAMHAKSHPGAFGYAPSEPKDFFYENSKNGM